jgi:sugar phosphate isomerase/epimerase
MIHYCPLATLRKAYNPHPMVWMQTVERSGALLPMNEPNTPLKRRKFLQNATPVAALAMGVPCWRSVVAAGPDDDAITRRSIAGKPGTRPLPPIQVGILLDTFRLGTLEARLDAVKACGLDCVQMSLDCAGLPAMPDTISPEVAGRIGSAAADRAITIASVRGTFNMSHPDAEERRAGLRRLRALAEVCPQLGTSKIHICTGTRNRDNMWRPHPDNDLPASWRDMAVCVREATDIARQAVVVLAFEPEVNNVVDSAKKARRLLDEIASPFLKITFDAANLFHAGELPRMNEILDEAFALIGKDVVLAHAKDLDHDGDAGHKAAGQGKLDYDRYLALLHSCGFPGPLLLHGLSKAQVPGCVAFLREKIARLNSSPPGK